MASLQHERLIRCDRLASADIRRFSLRVLWIGCEKKYRCVEPFRRVIKAQETHVAYAFTVHKHKNLVFDRFAHHNVFKTSSSLIGLLSLSWRVAVQMGGQLG